MTGTLNIDTEELDNTEAKAKETDLDRRVNLRRMIFALLVSANHSLICLFYFSNDNMRLLLAPFAIGLAIIWAGNLAILTAYLKGFTARLKDPVLTVPLMVWIGLGILVSAYYLQGFRLSVVMWLFGIMVLGAFRVRFRSFLLVTMAAIFGYAVVLYLLIQNHSENIDVSVEVIELLMFTMVSIGMLVTVTRIAALQIRLRKQSTNLNTALDKMHELATRDELTGLYNRRRVLELMREQITLANSGNYSFVICYLDLDHFKAVNDTYGHGVGDLVIKRFADVCTKTIRAVDYSGRLGGEEFVVVLTNTQMDEALASVERIRKNFETERYEETPADFGVTVSIGVAEFRKGEDLEDMLNRADNNLYTSKDTGRNKITYETLNSSSKEKA